LVCSHSERAAIDKAIVDGEALRRVAARFGPSASTLTRHKPHVARAIVRAEARRERVTGETLLDRIDRVYLKLEQLLARAESTNDLMACGAALREMRQTIETHRDLLEHSLKPGEGQPATFRLVYGQRDAVEGVRERLLNKLCGDQGTHYDSLPASTDAGEEETPGSGPEMSIRDPE